MEGRTVTSKLQSSRYIRISLKSIEINQNVYHFVPASHSGDYLEVPKKGENHGREIDLRWRSHAGRSVPAAYAGI
nr:MAG TPA: hypothetical protein [Caudoviricetes sp.]